MTLAVRLPRREVLPNFLVAVLVAGFVPGAANFAHQLSSQDKHIDPGARLAVIPVLVAALVAAAPGEHPFPKSLFTGIRVASAITAILAFASAWILLVNASITSAQRQLTAAAVLAWVIVALLALSCFQVWQVAQSLVLVVTATLVMLAAHERLFVAWSVAAGAAGAFVLITDSEVLRAWFRRARAGARSG